MGCEVFGMVGKCWCAQAGLMAPSHTLALPLSVAFACLCSRGFGDWPLRGHCPVSPSYAPAPDCSPLPLPLLYPSPTPSPLPRAALTDHSLPNTPRLSEEDITCVRPTQGFVVKTLRHENIRLNVWDVGGQKSIRPYWRNYFTDTDALIYVIDSSDRRRMEETSVELAYLLEEVALHGIPLVIFANKQDLLSSLTPAELTQGLNLYAIRDRVWQIFGCSAKEAQGLKEGIDFLAAEIANKMDKK